MKLTQTECGAILAAGKILVKEFSPEQRIYYRRRYGYDIVEMALNGDFNDSIEVRWSDFTLDNLGTEGKVYWV